MLMGGDAEAEAEGEGGAPCGGWACGDDATPHSRL